MKTFKELSAHQKDVATDKALEVLIKLILDKDWDYEFKCSIAQHDYYNAFSLQNIKSEFEVAWESDAIADELYPLAECMAEVAWYPTSEDYCLMDVV